MSKRITIDPITRIEGHLRIDAEINDGKVTKAWSSGQMWRGVELILLGRDPRDAWAITQRICGVCTTVHAITSVRAVENALNLEVPLNAQFIRNMISSAHAIHDHMVHFYHLSALDFVDVVSALKADPVKAAAWISAIQRLADELERGHDPNPRKTEELRRHRPAWAIHQRLLGPSGHEADAGNQSCGGGALSPGAGSTAAGQQDRHHSRLQDAAYSEPGGGRRVESHLVGQPVSSDCRPAHGDQDANRQARRLCQQGLPDRRGGRWRGVRGLDRLRQGHYQLSLGS